MTSSSGAAMMAKRIAVSRAIQGVSRKQMMAPSTEAIAQLQMITNITSGWSRTKRGPG
jgi:hypothetical protein